MPAKLDTKGGRSVPRLADVVEQDALDAPVGPAQRFFRAAAALAQAGIDGWRHDRAALEIRTKAVALCQADNALASLGLRALLMLIDEAVIQDRLSLASRALDAASDRLSEANRHVAFLETEWTLLSAIVLALEGRVDEALSEFRRGIALCERQGWNVGFVCVELLVGLASLYEQIGHGRRASSAAWRRPANWCSSATSATSRCSCLSLTAWCPNSSGDCRHH